MAQPDQDTSGASSRRRRRRRRGRGGRGRADNTGKTGTTDQTDKTKASASPASKDSGDTAPQPASPIAGDATPKPTTPIAGETAPKPASPIASDTGPHTVSSSEGSDAPIATPEDKDDKAVEQQPTGADEVPPADEAPPAETPVPSGNKADVPAHSLPLPQPPASDPKPVDTPAQTEHEAAPPRKHVPAVAEPSLATAGVVDTPPRHGPTPFQVPVRWGMLRQTNTLATSLKDLRREQHVVVATARGLELGKLLSSEQPVEPQVLKENLGEIVRVATADEINLAHEGRITNKQDQLFRTAREQIQKNRLPMKLCGIEKLLSGERTVFFFFAEGRVDFRGLLRDLSRNVRGRVEMRQLSARDEAKFLGDRSDCGQPLCCRSFLGTLEPIPMKFAKLQTSSLDPSKISGVCGRLKCCLRYEYEVYVELRSNLPQRGDVVHTRSGLVGRVIDYHILAQALTIVDAEERRERIGIGDVVQVERATRRRQRRRPSGGGHGGNGNGNSGPSAGSSGNCNGGSCDCGAGGGNGSCRSADADGRFDKIGAGLNFPV